MTPEEILAKNLLEENRCIPALFERRIGHVAEAADMLFPAVDVSQDDLPGVLADVGQRYLRLATEGVPDFSDVVPENRQKALMTFNALFECDATSFAIRTADSLRMRGMSLFNAQSFHPSSPFFVAYVENTLSNAAFSSFREIYRDAVPLYLDSTREVAQAVSDGRAMFAIVPIFGASGEMLTTSLRHIEEHELFFCTSYAQNEDAGIRFAIVAKAPLCMTFPATMMTCRVIPSAKFSAGAILRAASFIGMTPLRFDADRLSAHGNHSFVLTLSLDGVSPDVFITYAHMFTASCTVYGVYGII